MPNDMTTITTPTVLLNWPVAQANIRRMAEKAQRNGVRLRPHFKTPQSHHTGRYFRELGVGGITVSSLSMAAYFAEDGWDDITVAFPLNVREMAAINNLAGRITLNLLAVNAEGLALLKKGLQHPVGIFIKIDVGTHRTGLLPGDAVGIDDCLREIKASPLLRFKGFLAHAGHSYQARSKAEILRIHEETTAILRQLKEKYRGRYPTLQLSTGDTPTCSIAEGWEGLDEIRPGNFTFYDLMQVQIGSCHFGDIAVALACPVVAKHPERREVIVYGGGIHLSKDRMTWGGVEISGLPVLLRNDGWELPEEGCYVRSLSQEHGVVHCSGAFFEKMKIGGLAGILPVHSCMMADIATEYLLTSSEVWEKM
jgi:D-serine deaminase-like pyridoxal phosphate-dependent protein